MLKKRDRKLSWWDKLEGNARVFAEKINKPWGTDFPKLDTERKLIREKLKSLGRT